MMKRTGSVDLGAYGRAFALLARNPVLVVAPLAGFLAAVLLGLLPVGGFAAGIVSLLALCAQAFGIAVAVIIGDLAWRSASGKASFETGWADAQRKAPDILMATVGFTFALYAAGLVGNLTQSDIVSYLFLAVAVYFLIFTLPAAAIGGVPGGGALQASVERVQANRLNALAITVVFIVLWILGNMIIPLAVSSLTGSERIGELTVVGSLVAAAIKSVLAAYLALVLAKSYNDATYRR